VRNAESADTELRARALLGELRDMKISDVFDQGMHDYLTLFLARVNDLAVNISANFLVPLAPPETPETQELHN